MEKGEEAYNGILGLNTRLQVSNLNYEGANGGLRQYRTICRKTPKAGVGNYAMQYKVSVAPPVTPQGIEWLSFVFPLRCHNFVASQAASRQPRKEHGTVHCGWSIR
jgi:hypothetical protein